MVEVEPRSSGGQGRGAAFLAVVVRRRPAEIDPGRRDHDLVVGGMSEIEARRHRGDGGGGGGGIVTLPRWRNEAHQDASSMRTEKTHANGKMKVDSRQLAEKKR